MVQVWTQPIGWVSGIWWARVTWGQTTTMANKAPIKADRSSQPLQTLIQADKGSGHTK